jgi:Ca-activated chloride channel family protein
VTPAALGFDLLRGGLWPFAALAGLAARAREREALVAAPRLARFLPGFSRNRARARVGLATAGTLLLAFSVMGPVRGYTEREVRQRGVDIVVCLDTSRSMLSRDVRPSRFDRAKREIRGLVSRLAGDRVALVGFSGDAREVAPLTHDRSTLLALLDDASPADNRKGGTDIAAALEKALELFDGRSGNHEAIVLLTDGEDLEGEGAKVARDCAERNIRVYVVGVGTEEGGKIPAILADGSEGFLTTARGAEIVTRLDPATLLTLADTTGGIFLATSESPTPLEDLYEVGISRMDRRELEGGLETVPHDRFQWTLALALACILCEVGLRERRPRSRSRKEVTA